MLPPAALEGMATTGRALPAAGRWGEMLWGTAAGTEHACTMRLREHEHCTRTEEPAQLLRAHQSTATDHRQHQQRQHALGGADEARARRNAKVKHRRMEHRPVHQDHTSCHMHSANRTSAPSHVKAPASTATCAQSRGHALPSHHLLRNAPSSTPPTHACAHALAAAGTPGPQHGTPPENGHGHADTTRQQT